MAQEEAQVLLVEKIEIPKVEMKLCLGDIKIPGEHKDIMDLTSGDIVSCFLIDLGTRGADFKWIETALGIHARSFRKHSWGILLDIKEQIIKFRETNAGPRKQTSAIQVPVRGREVLVSNTAKSVYLCLQLKKDEDHEEKTRGQT